MAEQGSDVGSQPLCRLAAEEESLGLGPAIGTSGHAALHDDQVVAAGGQREGGRGGGGRTQEDILVRQTEHGMGNRGDTSDGTLCGRPGGEALRGVRVQSTAKKTGATEH